LLLPSTAFPAITTLLLNYSVGLKAGVFLLLVCCCCSISAAAASVSSFPASSGDTPSTLLFGYYSSALSRDWISACCLLAETVFDSMLFEVVDFFCLNFIDFFVFDSLKSLILNESI